MNATEVAERRKGPPTGAIFANTVLGHGGEYVLGRSLARKTEDLQLVLVAERSTIFVSLYQSLSECLRALVREAWERGEGG